MTLNFNTCVILYKEAEYLTSQDFSLNQTIRYLRDNDGFSAFENRKEVNDVKVLIADDQKDVCYALMVLLEHNVDAYETDVADSIDELIRKTEKEKFDILFLDWELTSNMGASTIKHLRRSSPDMKIIAMSVNPDAESSALSNGVDMFISKGENSDRLFEAIHKIEKNTGQ
jgi:DNA-binding NarL/FixJ family response regulator